MAVLLRPGRAVAVVTTVVLEVVTAAVMTMMLMVWGEVAVAIEGVAVIRPALTAVLLVGSATVHDVPKGS